MGTFIKGILGGFSGTVGSVIGGNWKGIDYMRSKSNRRKQRPTEQQQAQQIKFGLIMRFLQPMAALLNITFHDFAVKMTGINNAFKYTFEKAVTGVFPAFSIDYSKALVSRGKLPNAMAPAVTVGAASMLTFSWVDNSGVGLARAADQAVIVAYCPELQQAVYTTAGGSRDGLTAELNLLPFSGLPVHTWIGFLSPGGLVSNSIYTGEVTVS